MKLNEVIRVSVAAFLQKHTGNGVRSIVSFAQELHDNGDKFTRIYYTHSGPTREIRSHLYYGTFQQLMEDVDLNLTGES